MDARYFPYLNQPNAKEDINKQDIQESCTIYGNTQTPQQPTTSKCGNFIRSDLLPKTSDVVEDNFQFAPNKSMCWCEEWSTDFSPFWQPRLCVSVPNSPGARLVVVRVFPGPHRHRKLRSGRVSLSYGRRSMIFFPFFFVRLTVFLGPPRFPLTVQLRDSFPCRVEFIKDIQWIPPSLDYINIPVTRQQIAGFSSRCDFLTFARSQLVRTSLSPLAHVKAGTLYLLSTTPESLN